jgi:signal peptidase II
MFEGNEWITMGLTTLLLIVCSFCLIYERRQNGASFMVLCLSAIIGGGMSNLLDRVFMGYVTDMFSFGSFAIFNVADIFISCGCIALIFYIFFFYKVDR